MQITYSHLIDMIGQSVKWCHKNYTGQLGFMSKESKYKAKTFFFF